MSRQWAHLMPFVCLAVAMTSARLDAVTWNVATTTGVMQQPTSHYYHLSYGLQLGVASDNQRLGASLQYIERPEFVAGGFSDKESAALVLVTSKLTKAKGHGLYAGFGAGHLSGYIKATDASSFLISTRSYTVYGPAAMVEYAVQWLQLEASVYHQTLIGYVNDAQLKSMVAWPYNFYGIRLGYRW